MFSSLYKIRTKAGIQFNEYQEPLYDAGRDTPVAGDGSTTVFYTAHSPFVDANDDGSVTVADVVVYVNGTAATVSAIDADQGKITLDSPPANDAVLRVNYSWTSMVDAQVTVHQEEAHAFVEGAVGVLYTTPLDGATINPDFANSDAEKIMRNLESNIAASYILASRSSEENDPFMKQSQELYKRATGVIDEIIKQKKKLFDANGDLLSRGALYDVVGYPNTETPDAEGYIFERDKDL